MRYLATLLLCGLLAACGTNASGPAFHAGANAAPEAGQARVHVFRTKAAYLVQAAHIARPVVIVDGASMGALLNGGFLSKTITPGRHVLGIGSGEHVSRAPLQAVAGQQIFIRIHDKTRMAGSGAGIGGLVGAGVGVMLGAPDISRDGPTWAIEFMHPADALPLIEGLSLSR